MAQQQRHEQRRRRRSSPPQTFAEAVDRLHQAWIDSGAELLRFARDSALYVLNTHMLIPLLTAALVGAVAVILTGLLIAPDAPPALLAVMYLAEILVVILGAVAQHRSLTRTHHEQLVKLALLHARLRPHSAADGDDGADVGAVTDGALLSDTDDEDDDAPLALFRPSGGGAVFGQPLLPNSGLDAYSSDEDESAWEMVLPPDDEDDEDYPDDGPETYDSNDRDEWARRRGRSE